MSDTRWQETAEPRELTSKKAEQEIAAKEKRTAETEEQQRKKKEYLESILSGAVE